MAFNTPAWSTSPFGSTDVIDKATLRNELWMFVPRKTVVTCTLGCEIFLYPAILIRPESSSKGHLRESPIEHRQPFNF